MIKFLQPIKFSIIFSISVLFFVNRSFGQAECRSILGGHLTPVHKKIPVSWAIEETIAHGWMLDRNITNNLLFLGLDFSLKSHTVYFEGGLKAWRNSLGTYGSQSNSKPLNFSPFDRGKMGFREMYYMYSHDNTKLIAGLHTTTLDDYFLVDERTVGIDFKQNFGALGINANISSVLEDFTRMGNYCTVKYIYNTVKGKNDPYIGETFGETNFASVIISWAPGKKGTWKQKINDTEEFKEFNEEEPQKHKIKFENPINKYGIVFYEEFGDSLLYNKHYFGFFFGLDLPFKTNLEIEALDQLIETTHTLGYFIRLKKNFTWKIGSSSINLIYTGKYTENNSVFYPAYSNLYMGEIMRLDTWDMPILSASIKHSFRSKIKPHIRLKVTEQIQYPYTSSIDFEAGIKFLKHCKLTTIFSRIDSEVLENENYMARVELRIAF